MAKKKWLLPLICGLVLVLALAGVFLLLQDGGSIGVGPCIAADNGRYLIVLENSPVAMHPRAGNEDMFANLRTGDRILIVHDGVNETMPGQTGVYFLLKLGEGAGIPDETISILKELGWLAA